METVALAKKHGERLLQIHIAGLAALATLMLGLGQGDFLLPVGMGLAAFLSLWLTDITGWFRLPRTAANLIALAAVLWIVKDLRQWYGLAQVMVIAKLLVYLQGILLFQKKDARTYWQLGILSLLQVVVAAVFQQGILFGILLMMYFLLALWAMILFFLYREWEDYDRSDGIRPWLKKVWEKRQGSLLARRLFGLFSFWTRRRNEQDSGGQPHPTTASPFPQPQDVSRTCFSERRRWPLADQQARFHGGVAAAPSGLGWPIAIPVAKIALTTWALTLLLFFVIPRPGVGSWRGLILPLRHVVGFTDQVTLGELGRIIKKSDEVLRIRFFDRQDQPYSVEGPLYLRGAVLASYQNGHWRFSEYRLPRLVVPLRTYRLPTYRDHIRQEITIEPTDRQELFCLWPFAPTAEDPLLFMDVVRHRLLRPEELCRERFTYSLWTTALEDHVQAPLNPVFFSQETLGLLQMPRDKGQSTVPSLEALAREWIQQAGIALENRYQVARLLEARLKFSGRFKYSLQGQPRNPDLDPVEDFVAEHPEGHCEYFATALALMLRSVGIPCRVVLGYLCDEWNPVGEFFQVRQWHAHMWVEAYLEPQHLAPVLKETAPALWKQGAWLRLDPTPLADPFLEQPFYMQWVNRLHALWANYVVELDRFRQTEAIYRPLLETLQSLVQRLQDPAWWMGLGREIWKWVQEFLAEWRRSGWFSLPGFFVSFLIGLVLGGMVLLLQKLKRRFRQRTSDSQAFLLGRRMVEFYQRLERLLQSQGLRRLPHQTPLEFAFQTAPVLAERLQNPQWAILPVQVVEMFYRVRFGREELGAAQTHQIEHTLEALKKALLAYQASASKEDLRSRWQKKIRKIIYFFGGTPETEESSLLQR